MPPWGFSAGEYEAIPRCQPAAHGYFSPVYSSGGAVIFRRSFLDVTHSRSLFGDGGSIGRAIQEEIDRFLGLSASVGVAPNKFLAKIASDVKKPRGFVVVDAQEVMAFLHPLPVERLWGVGEKMAQKLRELGLQTIGEVACHSEGNLAAAFGEVGRQIYQLAWGIDDRPVIPEREVKSVGRERTFHRDEFRLEQLQAVMWELVEDVAWRLRRKELRGRTVQVKIRTPDFRTSTRRTTLMEATDLAEVIAKEAWALFNREWREGQPLRLLGVSVANLEEAATSQMNLFEGNRKQEELTKVMDRLAERYGRGAVKRARLLMLK